MLIYPPGKLFQRSEDRAQCNVEESAVTTVHACNDLGYAAAVLRNGGYDVFLRDYQTEGAGDGAVLNDILSFKPDLVFMSITNATVIDDIDFISRMKKQFSFKAALKGAIFYNTDEGLLGELELDDIDFLIGGEEEFIIKPLCDCALCGEGKPKDIDGIFFKNEKGELVKTKFGCWRNNLDSLPFPARDLMNNALYTRPDTNEILATISVSRGCPSGCTYCLTPIISGRKLRIRSVENVFEEMQECYFKYDIRNFFFRADTFTYNNDWVNELCDRIIASDMYKKIEFTCNTRVDTVTPQLLEKLKKAGCFMLVVGFESGSDDTLRRIGKGTSVEDNIRAAKMIKASKIPFCGCFMIGFPWETEDDIKQTLNMMFRLDPDFMEIHIAMPYYSTKLYDDCLKYKTISASAFGCDYFSPNTTGTESVPIERVIQLKKEYNLKFYLRPDYITKKVAQSVKNPKVLLSYYRHGMKLLNKNIK